MIRPLALAFLVLAVGCGEEPTPDVAEMPEAPPIEEVAVADIAPIGDGTVSGTVTFTQLDDAVEVRYDLSDFSGSGLHGMHVHETGDCGPDSTGTPGGAAGGHFNPLAAAHGAPSNSPSDRHAGDLGNVEPTDGRAAGTRMDSLLALDGPTAVIGRTVVIHGGRDDLTSQPSGDAGPRVGCGVVRAVGAAAPDTSAVSTP